MICLQHVYEETRFFHCRKQTDEEASCLSKQSGKETKISLLFIQDELDQKLPSSMPVAELQSQFL